MTDIYEQSVELMGISVTGDGGKLMWKDYHPIGYRFRNLPDEVENAAIEREMVSTQDKVFICEQQGRLWVKSSYCPVTDGVLRRVETASHVVYGKVGDG